MGIDFNHFGLKTTIDFTETGGMVSRDEVSAENRFEFLEARAGSHKLSILKQVEFSATNLCPLKDFLERLLGHLAESGLLRTSNTI